MASSNKASSSPLELLARVQAALGTSQAELGQLLGRSTRTIARYQGGAPLLDADDWRTLASAVYAKDPELAAALATAGETTLEALGLIVMPPAPKPPPAPAPPTAHLVDSIVCATAEALGSPPAPVRPAVLAAFDRAASLGLSIDDVRNALRPKAKRAP